MSFHEIVVDPSTGEEFQITWTGDADRQGLCPSLSGYEAKQEALPKGNKSRAHGGIRSNGPVYRGAL